MKKKSIIYFFVIALVIGFASVTANLIINNTLNIGFNNAFLDNVIFINTKTDGKASISLDGKTISYEAKELTSINEENILTFWIKNENTQYDVEAIISCSIDNISENIKDLVSISVEPKNFTLVSNEVKSGEVRIEMTSVVTESIDGNFTCELIATPVEREETGVITDTCVNALNGAEPVINGKLIPVKLDNNGVVTYSDESESWYNYCEQKWANAVILIDSPSKTYNVGDTIQESDIESYFVWIPRYRYRLFHTDQADGTETKLNSSIAQTIDLEFESKDTLVSNGSNDGEWLTHPAFTNFDVNGLWVGKFETGYKGSTSKTTAEVSSSDPTKIQVKPNVNSWRNNNVGNFFKAMV